MRFCVIGLKWGRHYIRNIEALGENLVCICSRDHSNVPEEFQRYKHVCDYRNVDIDAVDIVCITTPPDTHFEIAAYFMERNKHVIVEKPLVFSSKEAVELKGIAGNANVSFLTGYQYLWQQDFVKCQRDIKGYKGDIQIRNETVGTVARREYSLLWDYASHDLAMSFSLIEDPSVFKIDDVHQNSNGFSYMLRNGNNSISGTFLLTESTKTRSLQINTKDKRLVYADDHKFNAVRQMIADFTNHVKNNIRITNIDTSLEVIHTLREMENRLKIDNNEE